jgi:hypothetical protein
MAKMKLAQQAFYDDEKTLGEIVGAISKRER